MNRSLLLLTFIFLFGCNDVNVSQEDKEQKKLELSLLEIESAEKELKEAQYLFELSNKELNETYRNFRAKNKQFEHLTDKEIDSALIKLTESYSSDVVETKVGFDKKIKNNQIEVKKLQQEITNIKSNTESLDLIANQMEKENAVLLKIIEAKIDKNER